MDTSSSPFPRIFLVSETGVNRVALRLVMLRRYVEDGYKSRILLLFSVSEGRRGTVETEMDRVSRLER